MDEISQGRRFKHKKKYGQNFLTDPRIPAKIAAQCTESQCEADGKAACAVLEIGPGKGILTKELAKRFQKVAAVEIDPALMPILSETLADFDNVELICGDILKTDLAGLSERLRRAPGGETLALSVCANLPYYITTPIIMALLESGVPFSYITVMVQKEVAQRLCAKAGERDYGAITASVNLRGGVRKLFDVAAGSFHPRPAVGSSVVRIKLHDPPLYSHEQIAAAGKLIRASFGMRRKTLLNALSSPAFGGREKKELSEIISRTLGYGANVRGEQLSAREFVELSQRLL